MADDETTQDTSFRTALPLSGIRVLDAATLLAGPLAAALMGDLGADVVKIEDPVRGDPLRGYPPFRRGESLINKVTNRNKRAVTLNLRDKQGQELFRRLVARFDVVIVNFRPDRLLQWEIDYPQLTQVRPDIVMLHVSAFGRTGPYRQRPGFARIAEAYSGLAHVTGFPEREPVLSGYPIVDALTGVFGAYSVMCALRGRDTSGHGQLVDLALYEPLLRVMEDLIVPTEFGDERTRVGNINQFVAPNGMYECMDGKFVVLPISTDRMFMKLAEVIGRPDLVADFGTNAARVANRTSIDKIISEFMSTVTAAEAVDKLVSAGVPGGLINSPHDVVDDPHIRARGNLSRVLDPFLGETLTMQTAIPLGMGNIKFPARSLGEDNASILGEILRNSDGTLEELKSHGIC